MEITMNNNLKNKLNHLIQLSKHLNALHSLWDQVKDLARENDPDSGMSAVILTIE